MNMKIDARVRDEIYPMTVISDLNDRVITVSSPYPAMMHMILAQEEMLTELQKEVDTKDNFSSTIAKAINMHL